MPAPTPANSDNIVEFAVETTKAVSALENRVVKLETDLTYLTKDRIECNVRHTDALKELSTKMSQMQEAFRVHGEEQKVRDAGWSKWEKLVLALLTTVGGPAVLLFLTWLLSRMGAPVADSAAQAIGALSK
jgi:hypothetical protein